jgi:WD40 repeat protein
LSALVKGDLDWIVMKALEKDRNRRYETASSFAADVRRFLAEEPIEARPPSAWYRFRKMARRNKAALTTTGIVAAALVLGTALSIWQAVRATRAEHEAVVQRDEATQKGREAETAREQLRRTFYAAHLNLAQAAWEGGRAGEVLELLDREKAASPDLCGFEWHYWRRQCKADLRTLTLPGLTQGAEFSADGSRLASLSYDSGDPVKRAPPALKIWDTASGKELAAVPLTLSVRGNPHVLSADGTRLAIGLTADLPDGKEQTELVIADATTGRRLATVSGQRGWPLSMAFSPDGTRVAAVVRPSDAPRADSPSGELIIYDAATGQQLHAISVIQGLTPRSAFSPDGARIGVVSQKAGNGFESEVKVWDVASGQLVLALPVAFGGAMSATSVAFSPDGKALAAVGQASPTRTELYVWDIPSGRQRFTLQGPFRSYFVQLAFSPDSTRITCAGGDTRVGLWDAVTGQELAMYRGHASNVCAVAFSGDGRHLLSADATEYVKVWDAQPRADALVLNPGQSSSPTMSPDAQRIASLVGLPATEVKVWDLAGNQLLSLKLSPARKSDGASFIYPKLAFSPNGDRLAFGTTVRNGDKVRGALTVWDSAGKELLNLDEEGVGFASVALSPDGTRVAATPNLGDWSAGPATMTVGVWEIATGRKLLTTPPIPAQVWPGVSFSSDGTRLAAVAASIGHPTQILVWDATTGRECARWQGPTGVGIGIAFSRDGQRVAATAGGVRDHVELVVGDMVSGRLMNLGRAQGSPVFSPDGARLAAFSAPYPQSAEVSLWDVATGRQLLVLKGHAGSASRFGIGIAFSPSGDRIVSTTHLPAVRGIEVRTWDATPLPVARQP